MNADWEKTESESADQIRKKVGKIVTYNPLTQKMSNESAAYYLQKLVNLWALTRWHLQLLIQSELCKLTGLSLAYRRQKMVSWSFLKEDVCLKNVEWTLSCPCEITDVSRRPKQGGLVPRYLFSAKVNFYNHWYSLFFIIFALLNAYISAASSLRQRLNCLKKGGIYWQNKPLTKNCILEQRLQI
jgi:hypothetical protein